MYRYTGIENQHPKQKDNADSYKKIVISFIDAGTIVFDEKDWDDYEVYSGFVVIKKNEAWIAMYNMKEIFSVVLEK